MKKAQILFGTVLTAFIFVALIYSCAVALDENPSNAVSSIDYPPVAMNDAYEIEEGGVLTVNSPGVLENDIAQYGDPLTAALANTTSHGTLALSADGSFTYTPAANYTGQDTFYYKANDGIRDSSDDVIVLEEKVAGELLLPNAPGNYDDWRIDFKNVDARIKKMSAAKYDFILTVPMEIGRITFSYSYASRNIVGIGNDFVRSCPFNPDLKGQITGHLFDWFSSNVPFQERLLRMTFIHEIAHYWLTSMKGFYADDPAKIMVGHWISNIDLFYGYDLAMSPNNSPRWFFNGAAMQSINVNTVGFDPKNIKFSKLELYMMGLIPPEEVAPVKVFDYSGEQYFAGPQSTGVQWTTTREISIEDIIAANGERIPRCEDSQKDFKAAMVIIVPFGKTISQEFLQYVRDYKKAIPGAWAEMTGYTSTMEFVGALTEVSITVVPVSVISIDLEGPSQLSATMELGKDMFNTNDGTKYGIPMHRIKNTGNVDVRVTMRYLASTGLAPSQDNLVDHFQTAIGISSGELATLPPPDNQYSEMVIRDNLRTGSDPSPLIIHYSAPTELIKPISGMNVTYEIRAYPVSGKTVDDRISS